MSHSHTLNWFTNKHKEYDFLNEVSDIMILGFGGSLAYGTNIPTSDIDIRGIYHNSIDELLGIKPDSEQITDRKTDTVIYSMKKMFKLLANCNPNTIEILGLRPQDYIYISQAGQMILDNKEIFLSKKAIFTFGQYAKSQLNRLINKSGRGKDEAIKNEARSMSKVAMHLEERHNKDNLVCKCTLNKSGQLLVDFKADKMTVDQLMGILNELSNVHKDYATSDRNNKAIEHNKLNKHMMHLLRLYMMGIDILENEEIITYRKDEHDLLMDIRNNKYLEDDHMTPTNEFEQLLADYTKRFDEAAKNTALPDEPYYDEINKLAIKINKLYL